MNFRRNNVQKIAKKYLLWNILPSENFLTAALIISFCSIVSMELTFIFYNSLLTSVARPHQIGTVSGLAWGSGYFGAIVCLVIALFVFIQNDKPPFNLTWDDSGPIRATMILAAIWLLVFSIPAFIFVKEQTTIHTKNLRKPTSSRMGNRSTVSTMSTALFG